MTESEAKQDRQRMYEYTANNWKRYFTTESSGYKGESLIGWIEAIRDGANKALQELGQPVVQATTQTNQEKGQSTMQIVEVVALKTPTPLEAQNGAQNSVVVGPDVVTAPNEYAAIALFGAKHAKEVTATGAQLLILRTIKYNA